MELDLVVGSDAHGWVGWSADRSVLALVLIDAADAWSDADCVLAQHLYDRLRTSLEVTVWTGGSDLVSALVAGTTSPLPTDEIWGDGSCCVLGAMVREGVVEIVAAGALGAVLAPRHGRATPLYRPMRLVDRQVRDGELTRQQAEVAPHRRICVNPRFADDESGLTRVRRPLRDGDRVLLGAGALARPESADLWAGKGALGIRDVLAARGERAAPTAVVTV